MSGNYGVYAALYKKQKEKQAIDDKISFDEDDQFEDFPILKVHQVLALKVVFENDYQQMLNFNLNELVIMKNWDCFKEKFTADMIQRYGFVTVDLQNIDDKSSINFIHRVYAEFFVAMFIAKSLYFNHSDDENESVRTFELLSIVLKQELTDFLLIRDFITSYIKTETRGKSFQKKVKNLVIQKIAQIHKDLGSRTKSVIVSFGAYANLCCADKSLLKILWQTDKENNVLKQFIYKPLAGTC